MLIKLKNAQTAGQPTVVVPFSKFKFEVAKVLKTNGFITEADKKKKKGKRGELDILEITPRYSEGHGVIRGVKLISKPSRRMYAHATDLKPIKNGFGIAVVSTPQGILSNTEAVKRKVGGEVLFEIW